MIYLAIPLIIPFSYFLPWWGFVPPCFAIGLKSRSGVHSFISGSLSLFVVWFVAAYIFNAKSHGLMASKMALVFPLGGSSWVMLFVVGTLGGILGGLFSLLGYLFYSRVWKPQN